MLHLNNTVKNSSISIIIAGFVVMISLAMLFASISIYENSKLANLNKKIYDHPFSVSNAVLEANSDIIAMHRYMKDVVLATNPEELETALTLVNKHERSVYLHFEVINERFLGSKKIVDTAFYAFLEWKEIRKEVIHLKRTNQHKAAIDITKKKGARHVQLLSHRMGRLAEFARNKAFQFQHNSQQAYQDSRSNLFYMLVLVTVLSVLIASFVIVKVRRAEKLKNDSELRYEGLFKNSEVSIWSEDFSPILGELAKLRAAGVTDLRAHLQADTHLALGLAAKVVINDVNEASLDLFETADKEEFLSKINLSFGEDSIDVFIEELCAIWDKEESFQSEANFLTMKGKKIRAIVSLKIPRDERELNNIPISIVDISARKEMEKQLQLSAQVFEETHEGIVITDAKGLIIDVNPAFSVIAGYSRDEAIGENIRILNSGRQSTEFYSNLWQQLNDKGYWQGEIWNRKKNGEVYAELLSISSLKDAAGKTSNYVGIFTDITFNKVQQDKIKRMAHYDALTNLPNRSLLRDRYNQALSHSKRSNTVLAVSFLDLDNFKHVNDSYGHQVGDKLLIEIAQRLKSTVREEDTVARLGGDEFSLLLGDIKSSIECVELLERLIYSISEPFLIEGISITVTTSIGVSMCPSDASGLDVLLRNADQAMYLAKQEGKNNFRFFNAHEAEKVIQHHLKLQELHQALLNHELLLFYQPKVNMVSGKVVGVEALIRWQHPEQGLQSPINFLPILEGTPLEIEVGHWVIEQGIEQLVSLHSQGTEIQVSVNVSSNQFLHPHFFDDLSRSIRRYPNNDFRYFQLEILESSSLGSLEEMNNIISRCRDELNLSIALDDFGTGYSSLSHLGKLPTDTIKIDQSFVGGMLDDPQDFTIIDGVIALSKSFNRKLIAEGVETTLHGEMLILMGCEYAQGYAISRPISASDLSDWLQSYTPNQAWLEIGQENLTLHMQRKQQLKLLLKYWLENIKSHIQSGSGELFETDNMKNHFNIWLMFITQYEQLEKVWIDKIQTSFQEMIFITEELSQVQISVEGVERLHEAFENTKVTIEQCK